MLLSDPAYISEISSHSIGFVPDDYSGSVKSPKYHLRKLNPDREQMTDRVQDKSAHSFWCLSKILGIEALFPEEIFGTIFWEKKGSSFAAVP